MRFRPLTCLLLLLTLAGCVPTSTPPTEPGVQPGPAEPPRAASEQSLIAVSNSYLGAAVHDVLGQGTPLMLLAEPGMCPGDFDLRPSQDQQLRACRLLLRFD
jgi:ABC-type Zn uptake system ZnuABC Zn-binding protein ZnuA